MSHQDTIRDQFTRQAVPFSEARSLSDRDAIDQLVAAAQAGPDDRSLDVACGPGMVALAFAEIVRAAVGLDTTAAMLERARVLQAEAGRANLEWVEGEADALPFPDADFDIVTCRFAFHHMQDPAAALGEMVRVTKPGGRIVLCDGVASDDPAKATAFNAFERMRDPSTVHFLTAAELRGLMADAGLEIAEERRYRVPAELEGLMRASFPAPEHVATVRDLLIASAADDALGMGTREKDGRYLFAYPALILAAVR